MKQLVRLLFLVVFFASCSSDQGGGGPNLAPSVPLIVYPTNNLLCLSPEIPFEWSNSQDPENDNIAYQVEVSTNRSFTGIIESRRVNSTQRQITLPRGNAYYWRVLAIDSEGNESSYSAVAGFYVEGEQEVNHVPFSAALVFPEEGTLLDLTTALLEWEGFDTDSANLKYDLFFGEDPEPPLIQEDLGASEYEVTLESGRVYYWKVNVKDDQSTAFGEVWSFQTD